jgi:transcription initiation factor IIE alpha subunit
MSDPKKKVVEYLERHPDTDNFEISILLNIPIGDVRKILGELEQEGIIILNP